MKEEDAIKFKQVATAYNFLAKQIYGHAGVKCLAGTSENPCSKKFPHDMAGRSSSGPAFCFHICAMTPSVWTHLCPVLSAKNDFELRIVLKKESDHDLWLTSKVGCHPTLVASPHLAVQTPTFNPEVPYDEMIIWYPEALSRLVLMDETDVRADQTKRGHGAESRSVRTQAPGSRRGHRAFQGQDGAPRS